jgi:hypothetical protein
LLVFVLLFNTFGQIGLFLFVQNHLRNEIKEIIRNNPDKSKLEVITIPNSIIKNQESIFKRIDDKEFRYKGKMYDIVMEKNLAGSVQFYCINDKLEEKLIARFSDLKNNDNSKGLLRNNLIKQFKIFSFDAPQTKQNNSFFPTISIAINNYYFMSLHSIILDINPPPPKIENRT